MATLTRTSGGNCFSGLESEHELSLIWDMIPDMINAEPLPSPDNLLAKRLSERLLELRTGRGWSLDALAQASGVSRATLSRLERGEISPTTAHLSRLCSVYRMTLSRLMADIEESFAAHVRPDAQPVWHDVEAGFLRRSVSPPSKALAAEVIEVTLEPGRVLAYPAPTRPDHEHHLILRSGALSVTLAGHAYDLRVGDALRYRLSGPSRYEAGADSANYTMVLV